MNVLGKLIITCECNQISTSKKRNKYSLFDIETYLKFNLKIKDNHYLVHMATVHGRVDCLKICKKFGVNMNPMYFSIDRASANGHVHILQWWLDNKVSNMYYTSDAFDHATACGYIDVLKWWINSRLKIKYTDSAIVSASHYGYINILSLFKKTGLITKYVHFVLEIAFENYKFEVLDWWKKSGLVSTHDLYCSTCNIHADEDYNKERQQIWDDYWKDYTVTQRSSKNLSLSNHSQICIIL